MDKGNLVNEPSITCYMYCLLEAFSLVSLRDDEVVLVGYSLKGLEFRLRWTTMPTWTRI